MNGGFGWFGFLLGGFLILPSPTPTAAATEVVRIATYNVENYRLETSESRPAKTEASRAKVAEIIHQLRADVLALQEIGGTEALADLRERLRGRGCEYPHVEHLEGSDTNVQVALLSRWPIVERRPHTRDTFLLGGRRFRVSRGILEAEVQVGAGYRLTVFVAHLKSRRAVPDADEAEWRTAEARVLRAKIDARLREGPRANVVVLGDLNDTKDREAIRTVLGRGRDALVDTRPSERNGDTGYSPQSRWQPRTVAWTHYFGVEDSYSRIDYILLHPNAAREWRRDEGYVLGVADWGLASDHRPLLVVLDAADR